MPTDAGLDTAEPPLYHQKDSIHYEYTLQIANWKNMRFRNCTNWRFVFEQMNESAAITAVQQNELSSTNVLHWIHQVRICFPDQNSAETDFDYEVNLMLDRPTNVINLTSD
jgi:hypothetical protein